MRRSSSMTAMLVAAMIGMAAMPGMSEVPIRSRALEGPPTRRDQKDQEKLAKAEAKRQRRAAKRLLLEKKP